MLKKYKKSKTLSTGSITYKKYNVVKEILYVRVPK